MWNRMGKEIEKKTQKPGNKLHAYNNLLQVYR